MWSNNVLVWFLSNNAIPVPQYDAVCVTFSIFLKNFFNCVIRMYVCIYSRIDNWPTASRRLVFVMGYSSGMLFCPAVYRPHNNNKFLFFVKYCMFWISAFLNYPCFPSSTNLNGQHGVITNSERVADLVHSKSWSPSFLLWQFSRL